MSLRPHRFLLLALGLLTLPIAARADCTVRNTTAEACTLELAGSKPPLDAGATTTIARGRIGVRGKIGGFTSGRCRGSEQIEIHEERGTLSLVRVRGT